MSDTNDNSHNIDPELLSAFFDDETSAEERAHIEQLMDVSTDALQTLDEYDQLSQSLRDLHQSTPSPDLREDVLARIGATPVQRNPVAAPVTLSRMQMVSIAGSLAVAATLLVLVWPGGSIAPTGEADRSLAMNETAAELDAAALSDAESLRRTAGAGGGSPVPAAAAALDAAGTGPAVLAEMEEGIDAALSLTSLASKQPSFEPGDVLTYLQGNADEITWVAVTVVDVQAAGDQVQLLLSQYGVSSPVSSGDLKETRQQVDDQFLILVEADWTQLGAVIVDLNDQGFVHAMKVDAPPTNGVPAPLKGYKMSRDADSGQAESNRDIGPLRQQAQLMAEAQTRPAPRARAADAASAKGTLVDGAIQLPAALPDDEWRRLAAYRSEQSPAPSGPAAADSAAPAEEPATEPDLTASIGAPLASRRDKAVFVIQKSDD